VEQRSSLLDNSDTISITVNDTGIGMAKQEIASLFKPFGKLEDDHQMNRRGTGLGLLISKELSVALGGDLTVFSRKHLGTQFTFSFPYKPCALLAPFAV